MKYFFSYFEVVSVIIFSIEYLLRVWSCTTNNKYKHPLWGRIKFIFSPFALVDLFAILPFYLPMIFPFDLRFIRIIRLLRIFRLFKVGRYSEELKIFGRVLKSKKEELIITLFIGFILLILSASLMFFVENPVQPESFPNIPASIWWAITTLTTVSYGDVYPVTTLGKIIAGIISILGIGMFALPAGILSSGFLEEIKKKRTKKKIKVCPYCGKQIDDT